jgi:hypothetical protein
MEEDSVARAKVPWNKGKIVGQKAPLRLKDIWAIRIRLQLGHRVRELALFDLGLDSKLRACDLVRLRVRDICHGEHVSNRAIVMQQKTSQPVQFEITPPTREAVTDWIKELHLPMTTTFSLAACMILPTWVHGNTPASLIRGSKK